MKKECETAKTRYMTKFCRLWFTPLPRRVGLSPGNHSCSDSFIPGCDSMSPSQFLEHTR